MYLGWALNPMTGVFSPYEKKRECGDTQRGEGSVRMKAEMNCAGSQVTC